MYGQSQADIEKVITSSDGFTIRWLSVGNILGGGRGVQPQKNPKKTKPKMGIAGNVGFFEKGVESPFLNIPDNLI